ncbi:MAG: shikimate kinase [Neisseriaceae bacterium]
MQDIIIIGITGVGKTTVGKIIAEKLNKSFIDLDKNIESNCGVDVQTIFSIEGESGFRIRETNELKRILGAENDYVLSLGGGCVLKAENRDIIAHSNNLVVQLCADINVLVDRLAYSASKRPLFNNSDVESKVTELYQERQELYDSITDLKVNTSNLRPVQVAELVVDKIIHKKY